MTRYDRIRNHKLTTQLVTLPSRSGNPVVTQRKKLYAESGNQGDNDSASDVLSLHLRYVWRYDVGYAGGHQQPGGARVTVPPP